MHASSLSNVAARLSFIQPTTSKPFAYEYDPPPGKPRRSAAYQEHLVQIRNARNLSRKPSLDQQGFELRPHSTRVNDFYDDAEVRGIYYPELQQLVQDATGASSVVVFDHTVRGNAVSRRGGTVIHEPVNRVHNDYTVESAVRRVRAVLPRDEAQRLLRHRFVEVNVWRAIRGPLQSMPLAIADATSLRPADFVATDLIYRDRVGEIYYLAHNPAHEWYYYPNMRPDETLLLKGFDSDTTRARFGAHAAFEHPHTPPDAPPRESIEARTFAFFAPAETPHASQFMIQWR